MSLLESSEQVASLLGKWKDENRRGHSPVQTLNKISDILEAEATAYILLDADPFDDRHPVRSDPDCVVGHLLKLLYDDDNFLNKLMTSYMFNAENNYELNCGAARLLINMLPALNGADIFQDVETHVGRLFSWAKDEKEPLRSYACGLLHVAMQMPECPGIFKEKNAVLVPLVIKRLKCLKEIQDLSTLAINDIDSIGKTGFIKYSSNKSSKRKSEKKDMEIHGAMKTPGFASRKRKHCQISKTKGIEYNKPEISLSPLTVGNQQKLMLKYLHPMGEYQELLPAALELNVVELIFHYMNPKVQPDAQLACSALSYLASLLCHKKFIVEFVARSGIQKILDLPQPSTAATMSSLCLYYIAFSEDAVERICLLPQPVLHCLSEYLLWLLECSHISGRCHASLFFSMTFSFRSILNLFDSMDGLRKVVNMISTLKILRPEESQLLTDDDVFLDREMAKNACLTVKKYLDAHVAFAADEYKRSAARDNGNTPPTPVPAYKSVVTATEGLQENIDYIQAYEMRGVGILEKQFSKKIINLNVASMFLQLVAVASEWKNYNNRTDVMATSLEALSAMSASRKISLTFCQQIQVSTSESQSGFKILLRAVEGDLLSEIQVQKSAINVICNCVTTNAWKEIKNELLAAKLFARERMREMQVMQKIWSAVRINNGIKILLTLLSIKAPITEADSMRALVCKALYALSENDRICQVLGKLPIFLNEQLQMLMREPVLSEKMSEHEKFCKYASQLIERVTGKPLQYDNYESIPMLSSITKSDIVAQTKIKYQQKELLTIIHNHLLTQGLEKAAAALKTEGNLPTEEKPCKELPCTPYASLKQPLASSSEHPSHVKYSDANGNTSRVNGNSLPVRESFTPFPSRTLGIMSLSSPFSSPKFEKRLQLTPKRRLSLNTQSSSAVKEGPKMENRHKELRNLSRQTTETYAPPSLDSIVTGYLREQHAHCTNPVATCPPFSLLRPHQCPEPRYRNYASSNITRRLMSRQVKPKYGGIQGRKHNRRYLYSKFRSSGCIKESEDDTIFTCCAWLPDGESICLGTQTGDVKILNNYYGQEELLHSCHAAPISTCRIAKNYKLMTTSAAFGAPLGALWSLKKSSDQAMSLELKLELPEDNFVQFSNSEERVVGTEDVTAHIYDLTSGQLIRTFYDQRNANHYSKNFACFGPGDDLLLNDGCLWDVRAKNMVHKFDKFNDYVSGVFHPSGLEIIINSEVWDVRTFHLLDTCPALDQCRIVFSNQCDVIYGVKHVSNSKDIVLEHKSMLGPFESSFRTFDSFDYSAIGTVDVKKTIFDISPNPRDDILAVIENGGNFTTLDVDTTCRFYDIGRIKRLGEDDSEEEQEAESEEQSSVNENREFEDDLATLFNNIFANEDDFEDDTLDFDDESSNNDEDDDNNTSDDDDDNVDDAEANSNEDNEDDYDILLF